MGQLSGAVCIFDLDGTLVDSAPDLTGALNRQLTRLGMATMDPAEVRPLVGEGARALLIHSFEAHGRPFPDGNEADALVEAYVADYAAHICDESYVFEGVKETLDALASESATLAVCTNKKEVLAEPLLRATNLWDRFEIVVAADTLAERKPSPLPLQHIMEKTGADRGTMIGDTFTDYKAAEAANMPALIASFGYGANDERLRNATWFDAYADLPTAILEKLAT
ncbi:MAG: HAD-IA family hydrolase [Pseudomonadota bacterium]